MNSDISLAVIVCFIVTMTLLIVCSVDQSSNASIPETTILEATVTTESTTISTEPTTMPTEPETEPPTEPPTEPTTSKKDYTVYSVPKKYNKRDFKSYEIHTSITSKNTPHYELQRDHAYTAPNGIRAVNGRYCIALGSHFTTKIGQYVDIVLKNGTVIECILGDQKSDSHTDDLKIAHRKDGSIVEFIIDKKVLNEKILYVYGNMSYLYSEWKSPVVQVIVYDTNYFDIID